MFAALSVRGSSSETSSIVWSKTNHLFENLRLNQFSKIQFVYTNSTKSPIYIKSVFRSQREISRGYSLEIDYNKNVVKEGETGYVDVVFTPTDSPLVILDTVFALFNDNSLHSLSIKGIMPLYFKQPGPKLKFYDTIHDFGVINNNNTVEYVFKFVNSGSDYLNISKAFGTCGCVVVASFTKEPMAPGETGYIRVRLNPEAAKEEKVNKFIYIESNAGDRKLKVTAIVKSINTNR